MPVHEEDSPVPGRFRVTQFDKPLFNPDVLRGLFMSGRHLAVFGIKREKLWTFTYFWFGDRVGSTYDALFGSGSRLGFPEATPGNSFVNSRDQYLDIKETIPPPFSETTVCRDANGVIVWERALK